MTKTCPCIDSIADATGYYRDGETTFGCQECVETHIWREATV